MTPESKEEVKVENVQPEQPVQKEPLKPENTIEAKKETEETPEKINWRRFREEREKERRAKAESDRIAKEEREKAAAFKSALEAITNKPEPSTQSEQEEESEDQRIEKKVARLLAEREAKLEQERQEREAKEYPQRLYSTHKDFNNVCSAENVDYLEYHYPEVAAAFKHMPDGYDKWSNLYQTIKRFVPNPDSKKDIKKAEQNLAKPQSSSRSGLFFGPSTQPAGSIQLSQERREANWARMQREMRQVASE